MKQAKVTTADRKVVGVALRRAEDTGAAAAAIELEDGTMVSGKTSDLLGPTAAMLLNTLKLLAGIDHSVHIISPEAIAPLQKLKTEYLGSRNPRLHMEEVLIALSASSITNGMADYTLQQIPKLRGAQVHTTVMLSETDERTFQRLGVMLTSEPK